MTSFYYVPASIPSLAAGLTFGAILGYGAFLTSQSPPKPLLQLGTGIVLAGMMGLRFARSGKFMPPGFICALSCGAVVWNVVNYNKYLFSSGPRLQ